MFIMKTLKFIPTIKPAVLNNSSGFRIIFLSMRIILPIPSGSSFTILWKSSVLLLRRNIQCEASQTSIIRPRTGNNDIDKIYECRHIVRPGIFIFSNMTEHRFQGIYFSSSYGFCTVAESVFLSWTITFSYVYF